MDFERICYGCFREKSGDICPYCGYNAKTAEKPLLALPPGTILGGRYLTGKILGVGGFGITYLGYDLTLDTKVAIKEYMPSSIASRGADGYTVTVHSANLEEDYRSGSERFLDEARILAKLQQIPNIVTVQNFFKENNTAYFVMDYVDGLSLKTFIAEQGGRIPFEQAKLILFPVMEALIGVHEKGLLHRDISPDNIYITGEGKSKLLDFGAARFAIGSKKSMSVILKHGFAPEEQYSTHGKQGPWTDVYAMGATIYNCITGSLPPDSIDRLHDDTIVSPAAFGAVMPAYAESVLLKALAVRAEDRYQSMTEFISALMGDPVKTAAATVGLGGGATVGVNGGGGATVGVNRGGGNVAAVKQDKVPLDMSKLLAFFKTTKGIIVIAAVVAAVALAIILPLTLGKDNSDPGGDIETVSSEPAPTNAPVKPVPTMGTAAVPEGYSVFSNAEKNFSFLYLSSYECDWVEGDGATLYTRYSDSIPYVIVNKSDQASIDPENYFGHISDQMKERYGAKLISETGITQTGEYGGRDMWKVTYTYTVDSGETIEMIRIIEPADTYLVEYTVKYISGDGDATLAVLKAAAESFIPDANYYVEGTQGGTEPPAADAPAQTYTNEAMAFTVDIPAGYSAQDITSTGIITTNGVHAYSNNIDFYAFFTDTDAYYTGAIYNAEDFVLRTGQAGYLTAMLGMDSLTTGDAMGLNINGTDMAVVPVTMEKGGVAYDGQVYIGNAGDAFGCYLMWYYVPTTAENRDALIAQGAGMAQSFVSTGKPNASSTLQYMTNDKLGFSVLYSSENCEGGAVDSETGVTFFPITGNGDIPTINVQRVPTEYGSTPEEVFATHYNVLTTNLPDAEITQDDPINTGTGRYKFTSCQYGVLKAGTHYNILMSVGEINGSLWVITCQSMDDYYDLTLKLTMQLIWSFELLAS